MIASNIRADGGLSSLPSIPAKAGTQAFYRKALSFRKKTWVPAFAGMSGNIRPVTLKAPR